MAQRLLLLIAVLFAAYVLARRLLGAGVGAFLATVAFALTPKAHPIAVLWVSARSELLMALFSLLAVIAWIRWDRGDGRAWGAAAGGFYVLALLSKEPAALLPLLLLFTPPARRYITVERVSVVALMLLSAALILVWRGRVGARPDDPDTERRLRGSVGGYLNAVFSVSLGRTDIGGLVMYSDVPRVAADLQISCAFRNGEVILRPIPSKARN